MALPSSNQVIFGVVLGVRPEEGRVLRPEGWLRLATFAQITPVELEVLSQVEARAVALRWALAIHRADRALRAYVESLSPEERAKLTKAAERFADPEAEPALYADDPVFQDLVPPIVICWLWDGGLALRSVLLGARPEEGLILIRGGWLRVPTPDLDELRRAEELGVPLRLALLRRL